MPDQLELFRFAPPLGGQATQSHHIILAGRIVGYTLRRDRRRLAMRIDERGLAVGAPRNVPLAEIEAFLRSHGDWVLEKLDEHAGKAARRHLTIHDGACLPVLGAEVRVRVTSGGNRGYWHDGGSGGELWLAARPAADLSLLARRALQRRALEHFRPRLIDMAGQIGRAVPPLGLSSARTRWGSCSARSGIRLNWRLIHLPPATIDYVIAHEVAHLVEMNHGARFWRLVERIYPDWRAARAALKQEGAALPLI
ncbi:MAG: SprT family zinc-dependent metalloprotease [Pseudomonadota bacterium]